VSAEIRKWQASFLDLLQTQVMGKLSTPLLHGPAILLQYLSYLMKSSTFSPLSVQIPIYLVVVFDQSSDAAALMVRMQKKTGALPEHGT